MRSQTPQKDRAVSQTLAKGSDRSPHLPARSVCRPPVGEHCRVRGVCVCVGGGRAPPAALLPYLRPPHSVHSFARVWSLLPKPGGLSDLRLPRAAHFPAEALRPVFQTFPLSVLSSLRKGGRERNPFSRPLRTAPGAGEPGWPCGTAGGFVLRSCFLTI